MDTRSNRKHNQNKYSGYSIVQLLKFNNSEKILKATGGGDEEEKQSASKEQQ